MLTIEGELLWLHQEINKFHANTGKKPECILISKSSYTFIPKLKHLMEYEGIPIKIASQEITTIVYPKPAQARQE